MEEILFASRPTVGANRITGTSSAPPDRVADKRPESFWTRQVDETAKRSFAVGGRRGDEQTGRSRAVVIFAPCVDPFGKTGRAVTTRHRRFPNQ